MILFHFHILIFRFRSNILDTTFCADAICLAIEGVLNRQISVPKSIPLGPALTDVFTSVLANQTRDNTSQTILHKRCVDGTSIFRDYHFFNTVLQNFDPFTYVSFSFEEEVSSTSGFSRIKLAR